MLSFPIRTLSQGALQVAGHLASDDPIWMGEDSRPLTAVQVTGRLSGAGTGRYYFSGTFAGAMAGECRRCLVPVEVQIRGDANLLYADADDENADEPDVYPLSDAGNTLDLRPAIREQWLLEAQVLPVCKPDCLGFCPTCGANRNESPCDCSRVTT